MRETLLKVWGNLPSRLIGVAGVIIPTWLSARPQDLNLILGMSKDVHAIRETSIFVFLVFVVYWAVYFYLDRKLHMADNNKPDLSKIFNVGKIRSDVSPDKSDEDQINISDIETSNNEGDGLRVEDIKRGNISNIVSKDNKGHGIVIRGKK